MKKSLLHKVSDFILEICPFEKVFVTIAEEDVKR